MDNKTLDCNSIMRDILWYYKDGYDGSHFGMAIFNRPFEHLKDHLRENYFESYRAYRRLEDNNKNLILPRTRDFIGCAKRIIYEKLLYGEGFDFNVEGIGDFKDMNFYRKIEERDLYDAMEEETFYVDSNKIIVKDPKKLIDRCNQVWKESELIRCGTGREIIEARA